MREALIVIDGRPNATLAQVLEDFGVAGDLGTGWPRADLDLSGGVALSCDDWNDLSDQIEQLPQKRVLAFYAGPLDDLNTLEGRRISHVGRSYVIKRVPPAGALMPYAHRLLTIERDGIGHEAGSPERPTSTGPGNLFFCPLMTRVDVDELNSVGYAGDRMNAIMLPPVIDDPGSTYFADESVAFRRAMLKYVGERLNLAWTPTALTMMELVDTPIVRPFLTDGGCLSLGEDIDGATRIALEIASTDPCATYRAEFFEPIGRGAAGGLGAVRSALRSDVQGLSSGLELRSTRQPHRWGDYALRLRRPGENRVGSWQVIELLLEKLALEMSVELQDRLRDRVRNCSASTGAECPDHGLAEEAMVRDLARVPWAACAPSWGDAANTAWNVALVWFLLGSLASEAGAPSYGVPPWDASDTAWTFRKAGHSMTVYYPRIETSQVFRWRLHAPVGAVFLADEWSRIDHGDTMRVGETLRLQ